MKVLHIGMLCVVLVLLAGCDTLGLGSKRVDYRSGAAQAPALEIPPDLTAPGRDERYRMPQGSDETVATFSDYSKGGTAATARPRVKAASLERSGTQRWLLVKDNPENVWLVVKTFLQENNLPIRSEDQAAGVIETDWAENRPNVPRNWAEKIFDKINSSGERNQYRFRMEPGKDGMSTEIYVTHRGMEVSSEGNDMKWQARPNDPELEAIMLQRLMVRFGSSEAQASGAMTGVPGTGGAVRLHETFDGSSVIVVHDAFDRAWRRVGLAIERAGFVVEDKDRAKGIYFLRLAKVESGWVDKLQFWKDSEDTNARYRVNVKDDGTACEVSVTDVDGVNDNASKQMVEAIYKNIDQGETGAIPVAASAASAKALTIGATGPAGTASLQEVFDGSSVIVVNDAFDKSWRRVGLAIERAGLPVETNDRAKGIYFLRPPKAESGWLDKLQFWKDSEDTNTRYRVNVKDGGKACEVSVTDQNGVSDVAAKQMIEALYKNINQ
ncbi:MAG: outer membrane protein assembly factor BamC [Gallionella sp.]|nr:outer membrane protein assembly factor BamC [Gallionella sp.]